MHAVGLGFNKKHCMAVILDDFGIFWLHTPHPPIAFETCNPCRPLSTMPSTRLKNNLLDFLVSERWCPEIVSLIGARIIASRWLFAGGDGSRAPGESPKRGLFWKAWRWERKHKHEGIRFGGTEMMKYDESSKGIRESYAVFFCHSIASSQYRE